MNNRIRRWWQAIFLMVTVWGSSGDASGSLLDEKRKAANRLLHAAMSTQQEGFVLEDLKLLLRDTLEEAEIAAMMEEVKKEVAPTGVSGTNNAKQTGNECAAPYKNENDDNGTTTFAADMFAADRHAAGVLETFQNFDCTERAFDVTHPEFNVEEATKVLEKCRMVVLRNVFSQTVIENILPKYTQYIEDVNAGNIWSEGTTTFGGNYFILHEDDWRLNFMVTQDLAFPEIVAIDSVIDILSHPSILGEEFIVNHMGTLNAASGAPAQYWHVDGSYLYGSDAFDEYGVGGHDLPPFAINMFTPLLNMTYNHGPTEFCLGTSHLRGHEENLNVKDPDGLLADGIVQSLHQFERQHQLCPKGFLRIPLLNIGDVVLFDYMITHRGGPNNSKDLRSMLFTMYSRRWYRDTTFDINNDDEQTEFERLTELTRFAVVKRVDDNTET